MKHQNPVRQRNTERFPLPNGCSRSNLNVTPQNWQSPGASTDINWFVSYRFYDRDGSRHVFLRNMNKYKNLKTRQAVTKDIIKKELYLLERQGYNPILNKCVLEQDNDYVIHPDLEFSAALQKAFDMFEGESKVDLKSSLKYIQMSIKNLKLDAWPVKDIKKRHILRILNNCKVVKEREGKIWSNNQFNHYRTAIQIMYKIFVANDTVEHNIVEDVIIKKHAVKPRKVISREKLEMIDRRLHQNNFRFWLFIHIFFHSGARLTEMSRLQGENVDLERQSATYLVKKGSDWTWIIRPIPDEALKHWQIALQNCGPKQYVFSEGLVPGDKKICPSQYTRRWKTWVKKPVADEETKHHPKPHNRDEWMDINLYDLKHTRTTMISNAVDKQMEEIEKVAAQANGHTTTAMVKRVYDIDFKDRRDAKIKKMKIKLA